ncbi:G_PROTEIN_RECEP_F1_2 domain-containing protein [Caenorhabditis elegans]|nr:G_PROTEIN_RECEP_F1_2 domain-containing protein [Caenorhabditis elegans]CAH2175963.1 G_PROTEIN_RECEP_F1_2 domain-containing protein [Caenorhabditis elegans]
MNSSFHHFSANATFVGPPPTFHQILAIVLMSIKIILNSIGLLLNCLLLWLIISNYQKLHKTFSILLTYTLINDCLISVTLLLTIKRIVQCHETLAMVFFGPCTFVSTSFCHVLDAVHLHALQNWILSQILLIGFRTAMLSSAQSFISMKRTITFCMLAWLPGLISLGLHVTYRFSRPRLLELIHRCYSEDFSYSYISGYESFYNSPIPFTIAMLLLPNIPHYFLAYCFRHKQNNDLKRTTMSMTTLRMHSTLRKVSTMKAFLPLFLLADVLIYFFCQLELLPPQFIEYFLGTISSSINILNPVIAMCCFRPYRKMFKEYYRLIISKLSAHPKVMFSEGSSDEVVNL